MDEKEIIRSNHDIRTQGLMLIIVIVGIAFLIGVLCDGGVSALRDYMVYGGPSEWLFSYGGIALLIIGIASYVSVKSCEIVVTDKRVYGKTLWGKTVNLPLDRVSAVGKSSIFNGIEVSSSSGLIRFYGIGNCTQIYTQISNLLNSRQRTSCSANNVEQDVEELKAYKNLLEQKIITEAEFKEKKKQILERN